MCVAGERLLGELYFPTQNVCPHPEGWHEKRLFGWPFDLAPMSCLSYFVVCRAAKHACRAKDLAAVTDTGHNGGIVGRCGTLAIEAEPSGSSGTVSASLSLSDRVYVVE